MVEYVDCDGAPTPGGHYSQAAIYGDFVFISGQLPAARDDVDHAERSKRPFADQARQVLLNLLAVLESAGGRKEDLVKVSAYIVGVENWTSFNEVYASVLGAVRPARVVVPTVALHHGYLVEVEAVAVRSGT